MAQPFTLKLGALDLSNYVRLAPGDGFDPMDGDGFLTPGFVDAPLAEGMLLTNVDAGNREMAFPLHLKDDTLAKSIVPNGTFEDNNTAGWVAGAGGTTLNTFGVSAGWSSSGLFSLRASFTQPDATTRSPNVSSATGAGGIPIYPGASMAFAATVNLDDNPVAGTLRLRMFWYKADGTGSATTSTIGATFTNPATGIYSLASNFTVPSDAYFCRIVVEIASWTGSLDTCSFYLDDVTMFLTGGGKDAVHALVRAINTEIATNSQLRVEWKDQGATNSTFYDVAFARFDPEFNYRKAARNWESGTLKIWCSPPYGHTATAKIIATGLVPSGMSPVAMVPIATLAGDMSALGMFRISPTQTSLATPFTHRTQMIGAVAVLPHPSYSVWWSAASVYSGVKAGATWAYGSQIIAAGGTTAAQRTVGGGISVPGPPNGNYGYGGRNRLFALVSVAVASSAASVVATVAITAVDQQRQLIGPTAVLQALDLTHGGESMTMVDCGVFTAPTWAQFPNVTVNAIIPVAAAPILASLALNGLITVPDDTLTYADMGNVVGSAGFPMLKLATMIFDSTSNDDQAYSIIQSAASGASAQTIEAYSVDAVRRGKIPRIPATPTTVVAVIAHFPAVRNDGFLQCPARYDLLARERFQFAR